jgi:hypothetical protein
MKILNGFKKNQHIINIEINLLKISHLQHRLYTLVKLFIYTHLIFIILLHVTFQKKLII